jgi:hypothetical protein
VHRKAALRFFAQENPGILGYGTEFVGNLRFARSLSKRLAPLGYRSQYAFQILVRECTGKVGVSFTSI